MARYGSTDPAFRTFTDYMTPAQVVNHAVGYWLREIEKSAAKLTGLSFT